MKVRKPQSKRKSTRLQKGIEKKVAAHNRKQRKLAKKDVTWKSRRPKDLGIPNSFPYKGELLEEIEEHKKAVLEERAARRERQRQEAIARGASAHELEQLEMQQDVIDNQDRLGALMNSVQQAAAEYNEDDSYDVEMNDVEDIDDEEVGGNTDSFASAFEEVKKDTSRKAFDKFFHHVVDNCDIIIQVLDARNPLATRSKAVEKTVLQHPGKRFVFVLNKIDLVPTENLKEWIKYLSKSFPTIPLNASAATSNAHVFEHPKNLSRDRTATALLDCMKKWASEANLGRSATVGVIGFPNVGKSSVINALLGRHGRVGHACPVGAEAGVTTNIRRIKITNDLSILDSPGIVFPSESSKGKNPIDEQARLILLNAMQPRNVDDCIPAVTKLVKKLRKNPEQWELFCKHYDIPALIDTNIDEFVTQVLVHVARKMGRLNRGGIANLRSAASLVVGDWVSGRIAGWTEPPAAPANNSVEIVPEWTKEFSLDGILDGLI